MQKGYLVSGRMISLLFNNLLIEKYYHYAGLSFTGLPDMMKASA